MEQKFDKNLMEAASNIVNTLEKELSKYISNLNNIVDEKKNMSNNVNNWGGVLIVPDLLKLNLAPSWIK